MSARVLVCLCAMVDDFCCYCYGSAGIARSLFSIHFFRLWFIFIFAFKLSNSKNLWPLQRQRQGKCIFINGSHQKFAMELFCHDHLFVLLLLFTRWTQHKDGKGKNIEHKMITDKINYDYDCKTLYPRKTKREISPETFSTTKRNNSNELSAVYVKCINLCAAVNSNKLHYTAHKRYHASSSFCAPFLVSQSSLIAAAVATVTFPLLFLIFVANLVAILIPIGSRNFAKCTHCIVWINVTNLCLDSISFNPPFLPFRLLPFCKWELFHFVLFRFPRLLFCPWFSSCLFCISISWMRETIKMNGQSHLSPPPKHSKYSNESIFICWFNVFVSSVASSCVLHKTTSVGQNSISESTHRITHAANEFKEITRQTRQLIFTRQCSSLQNYLMNFFLLFISDAWNRNNDAAKRDGSWLPNHSCLCCKVNSLKRCINL